MQNQTFYVLYKGENIITNPSDLYNSSRKFRELVDNADTLHSIHLNINYDKFSTRNVKNFLKLCQNETTDAQNSELEEICLIAKMFDANKIFYKGLDFVQKNIDPNFYVSEDKFNDIPYLQIETNEIPTIHHADLNELEFNSGYSSDETEDNNDQGEKDNYQESDTNQENNNQNKSFDQNEAIFQKENINNNQDDTQDLPETKKKQHKTVCYQITSDTPFMKCRRYYLKKDNQIICMAKQKDNEIYIGEGENVHIGKNNEKNATRIIRTSSGYNVVLTNDQEFKIYFIKFGNGYSMEVSFDHNGTKLDWTPKHPRRFKSYNGGFGRTPIRSKKNTILQNSSNRPTFIVRKMTDKIYEAECNPTVNHLVVFAIALSQIVGPYCW